MRVFCPPPLTSALLYPLFQFRFTPEKKIEGLFKDNLPENYFEKGVEYVALPEDADVIVLPNNFVSLPQDAKNYIATYAEVGEKHNKKVFIFSCGDHTDGLVFDPRVYVFRYSIYRSKMTPHDICAPTLTEDLGREGITPRIKEKIPTVSFCGKAGFSTPKEALAAELKRIPLEVKGVLHREARAYIRGVLWRIWVIKACARSSLIKTLFIIRKTFSGAQKTIELDPKVAREDFIRSMKESDFVLAPKGDGNYSNRFLEALSMGRFPVVLDTDCIFPFESAIDYKKVTVVVPMNKLRKTPEYIREFYDALSPEEYSARQTFARNIFETYLRQDSFFRHYFSTI